MCIIRDLKYDTKIVGKNTIKILVSRAEREKVMSDMRNLFEERGFEYDSTRGSSLGQLKRLDRENGTVTILVKPNSSKGCAANMGADYEKEKADYIQQKYGDLGIKVETAGFGHGSDLQIISSSKTLNVELKTACGADYGQFTLGYNITKKEWVPITTKGFRKNEALFSMLHRDYLSEYLNEYAIFTNTEDEHLTIKNGVIVGLKPHKSTGAFRDSLNMKWFKEKKDLKAIIDFKDIAEYYSDKGDQFIQIKGKGLYAFNEDETLNTSLFVDKGKKASVRFRIKPGMAHNGRHSFTAAIKLIVDKSERDLDIDEDLDDIIKNII